MGRVALPFLPVPVTTLIPRKTMQLEENAPIGQHIRKKRLDLKLLQREVADLVGITEECMTNWENGKSVPQIQYMPKLIQFLGYNPLELDDNTLAGRIKNYRVTQGLSHKKMGKLIGVDASTIAAWESAKSIPKELNIELINKVIQI